MRLCGISKGALRAVTLAIHAGRFGPSMLKSLLAFVDAFLSASCFFGVPCFLFCRRTATVSRVAMECVRRMKKISQVGPG